ncbi:MAG TPA: universal stress protein [Nocardioides sp.]|nr:universal stress protein [Nocardioides sp.]
MATHEGVIVVGVDDSRAARAALEFALDEGRAHGCAVEVVTAWLWSSPYRGMDHVSSIEEGQHVASAVQDDVVRRVLVGRVQPPAVSQVVVHQDAGPALVERAEAARMLVVGSAHKGAVRRAVLGSVSEYCLSRASVPVVVVADAERLRNRSSGAIRAAADAGPRTWC